MYYHKMSVEPKCCSCSSQFCEIMLKSISYGSLVFSLFFIIISIPMKIFFFQTEIGMYENHFIHPNLLDNHLEKGQYWEIDKNFLTECPSFCIHHPDHYSIYNDNNKKIITNHFPGIYFESKDIRRLCELYGDGCSPYDSSEKYGKILFFISMAVGISVFVFILMIGLIYRFKKIYEGIWEFFTWVEIQLEIIYPEED